MGSFFPDQGVMMVKYISTIMCIGIKVEIKIVVWKGSGSLQHTAACPNCLMIFVSFHVFLFMKLIQSHLKLALSQMPVHVMQT